MPDRATHLRQATLNIHSRTHSRRAQQASQDAFLSPLFQDYRERERRSREARYDLIPIPPVLAQRLGRGEFERIRTPVRQRLGLPP